MHHVPFPPTQLVLTSSISSSDCELRDLCMPSLRRLSSSESFPTELVSDETLRNLKGRGAARFLPGGARSVTVRLGVEHQMRSAHLGLVGSILPWRAEAPRGGQCPPCGGCSAAASASHPSLHHRKTLDSGPHFLLESWTAELNPGSKKYTRYTLTSPVNLSRN
jgi:hypothetical protein